jgi:hypothetical protein
MKQIVKQLLTGKDNETYDLGRISWVLCVLATIAFCIYNLIHNIPFTLEDFGRSIAAIVGVHGAAIWAKRDTEPSPQADSDQNNNNK